MSPFVVAITATRHRLTEITRLVRSLETLDVPLGGMVLVDNGADPQIESLARTSRIEIDYVAPEKNLGCGGALRVGELRALARFSGVTHLWILDDDVVPSSSVLTELLNALSAESADAAAPLIVDKQGRIGWESGLVETKHASLFRETKTAEQFLARSGSKPIPVVWTQGVCLLITRRVIDELGPHAEGFWIRGEDFEFALRITAHWRGVLVPTVTVQHLVPAIQQNAETLEAEYRKQCAMVQNVTFLGIHVPHGRRLFPKIPGRYYRHFRNWGINFQTMRDAAQLFWQGAVCRRPAGEPTGRWPMEPRSSPSRTA